MTLKIHVSKHGYYRVLKVIFSYTVIYFRTVVSMDLNRAFFLTTQDQVRNEFRAWGKYVGEGV